MKKTALIAVVAFSIVVQAQQFTPPSNKNAALRYWTAFAEMKEGPTNGGKLMPVDSSKNKLMDDVLDGTLPWDEARLGPIVGENSFAIRSMQRGTELPDCNWGLDYSLGSAMPLAHLPKARVLARLNALYGARQLAKGNVEGAVATWLAGLRFAQHVGAGIGLIGNLSAKPAFEANLHLLTRAVQSGALNPELQDKVRKQIGQLPADGLNWVDSIKAEEWAGEEGLRYLAKARDFQGAYKDFFNRVAPQSAHPPTAAEIAEYRNLMNEVIAIFQLPPAQTKERLDLMKTKFNDLNPAVSSIVPNYQRLNDSREKLIDEKETLLKALK